MEAFFTYYDWLYDQAFGTGDFQYGYPEGYDYDIVDGEAVYDSAQFAPPVTDPFMPGKSTALKNTPTADTMQPYVDVLGGIEPESGVEIRAAAALKASPQKKGVECGMLYTGGDMYEKSEIYLGFAGKGGTDSDGAFL